MKNRLVLLILTLTMIAQTFSCGAVFANNADNQIVAGDMKAIDTILFGENTHNIKADKGCDISSFTTAPVGELTQNVTTRKLAAKGNIEFDISFEKGKVLTLEFEEMHNKSLKTFAYNIYVEGVEVYLRSFTENSAGPCHFFVEVPKEITSGKSTVRVKLANISDDALFLNRAWAFSNFDELIVTQNLNDKMNLILFSGVFGRGDNKQLLEEQVDKYKELFGTYNMYNIGIALDFTYLSWSDEELYEYLKNLVDVSREKNVPFAISVNSWWGGTPGDSPDGKGGFLADLPYQQLVYDPINIDGRGVYKPTTPNIWSNTPWLSMNDDHYNKLREDKYVKMSKYTSELLAKSRLEKGGEIPQFSIFVENEPIYWPYSAFNASPNAEADFSPKVVADAKADGVKLDPTDGLTTVENEWLFKNLNTYVSGVMSAAAEGSGSDYVIVDNNKVVPPTSQLIDNYYTHMFDTNETQAVRVPWNMFETHMTKNGHFGNETNTTEDSANTIAMMDYIIARGKYSVINIERTAVSDFKTVKSHYAFGADYSTIYNILSTDAPLIAAIDNTRSEKFTIPSFEKEIMSYDFLNPKSLELNSTLVDVKNTIITPQSRFFVATPDNGKADGGSMTFKVDNKGKPLSTGLTIELTGRILNTLSKDCKMEIFAGSSIENMKSATVTTNITGAGITFDVSDFIDKTKPTAYVKIKMNTIDNPTLLNWTSLSKVRAMVPFERKSGHTNGLQFTRDQTRHRNIMISLRADFERDVEKYVAKAGKNEVYQKAMELYNQGKYGSAKQMLLTEISYVLPAKFLVNKTGRLAQYPMTVTATDINTPISITLKELTDEKVVFDAKADKVTSAKIDMCCKFDKYSLVKNGVTYTLTSDKNGDILAKDGNISFTIDVGTGFNKMPRNFSALTAKTSFQSSTDLAIISQDEKIGEYAARVLVPYAKDVVIKRGAVGAKEEEMVTLSKNSTNLLNWGEQVDITTNEKGEVTKALIYYGTITGEVIKVSEAQFFPEMTSPFIEIKAKDGTVMKFEISSKTALDSSRATGTKLTLIDHTKGIGFKEGDMLSVDYVPLKPEADDHYIAGRVYENFVTVFEDEFNNLDESTSKMLSSNNLKVVPLDNNYVNVLGLTPASGSMGTAIWKITSPTPIDSLAVEYAGRTILGSAINIYAGANGYTYKNIASVKDSSAFDTYSSVLTENPAIVGGNTMYVKVEINTKSDTWGFLNGLKIKIKTDPKTGGVVSLESNEIKLGNSITEVPNLIYQDGTSENSTNLRYSHNIDDTSIVAQENGRLVGKKAGTTNIVTYVERGVEIYKIITKITVK